MPATLLSHQALVLPLKMRWPHRFSGLALCIGSMVPDFEFIWRMTDDWIFSHTMAAQAWFTVPVTVTLVWLVTRLAIPTLLPYVGEVDSLRLHDLAAIRRPSRLSDWVSVACSAWIGGMSHVLLDAVTHGNHSGWLVPHFPVLRAPIDHFGAERPLYDVLQIWFTLTFAAASLVMWRHIARHRLLWRWQQRPVEPRRSKPRRAGTMLAAFSLSGALLGATVGHRAHEHAPPKAFAAAIAFGALDFAAGTLLLAAVALRARQRGSPVGTLASARVSS
ncbi:MAG: DUF4184 family protein [Gemmatimonadaceae bacterium]|nr:DUF4184 family protein [Gemmatimonadaceae bacterium]